MLSKFKFKIIFLGLILFGIIINSPIVTAKEKNIVNIYFFHSDNCSHCRQEDKLLEELVEKYNNIRIYSYEIHEDNNQELMNEVGELFGIKLTGVPVTVIGDSIYTGYSDEKTPSRFVKTIEYYSKYDHYGRTGIYLDIDTDMVKKVENQLSLREFIESYNNYQLVFRFKTDDLSISNNSFIIGILLGLNPIMLLGLILVIFMYRDDNKNLIVYSIIYIIGSIIGYTSYSFINSIYIKIFVMIMLGIGWFVFRNKSKISDYLLIGVIISLVNSFITYFFRDYLGMFNNLLSLNMVAGINRIIYYLELYFSFFLILMSVFVVIISLKLKKKKHI